MTRAARKKRGEERPDPPAPARESRGSFLDALGEPAFHPPADVNETVDEVLLRMEVPGVRGGDIEVWVQGNIVEVTGEKRQDVSCAEANFLCLERSFGRFSRAFELSGCLDMTRVAADLRDGVLFIRIPKRDERRGHRRRVAVVEKTEP